MSDTAKMLLLTLAFFGLLITVVITRNTFLSYIIVAIVSAFVTELMHKPYQIITVKPREKSIEVLEIKREESA